MGVLAAVQAEIRTIGPTAESSVEAQRAYVLAAALDDRAGIQAGGLASTDKQLGALMVDIRERYRKPEGVSKLELLRGGAGATA